MDRDAAAVVAGVVAAGVVAAAADVEDVVNAFRAAARIIVKLPLNLVLSENI